ncbi:hypothetical protein KH388_18110 [Serratia rubidaea]|nr:hypothetical protein [Serratia rubidaea]
MIGDSLAGLPPLTRGTLLRVNIPAYPSRFIPARAGNTAGLEILAGLFAVYPRSRGEHSKDIQLNYIDFLVLKKATNFLPLLGKYNQLKNNQFIFTSLSK